MTAQTHPNLELGRRRSIVTKKRQKLATAEQRVADAQRELSAALFALDALESEQGTDKDAQATA